MSLNNTCSCSEDERNKDCCLLPTVDKLRDDVQLLLGLVFRLGQAASAEGIPVTLVLVVALKKARKKSQSRPL